jgi:hypothetical protein
VPCGRDHDHLSGCGSEHSVKRMTEHRPFVDADERLRGRPAEAGTGTGSDDDDRRRRHRKESHTLRLGRQYLVKQHARLVLVALLGERQLGDEDLTSLRQHPLLAG